jgi:hypothetical protein
VRRTNAGPSWGGFLKGIAHLKPFDASVRGSYGADGSWRNLFWCHEDGDQVAARRQGELRIHPIAAWSPNVPWLVAQSQAHGKTNVVDMDGGGTSASTPQVAAAAALWLEYNRDQWMELPPDQKWKKAEATYQALLRTAYQTEGKHWPDKYFGAGFLKANDALNKSFNEIVQAGPQGKLGAFERSPRDYFDGDKSFAAILEHAEGGVEPDGSLPNKLQNELKVPPKIDTLRDEALFRCFYNTRMLEAWHKARNPDKKERAKLELLSRKDVNAVPVAHAE